MQEFNYYNYIYDQFLFLEQDYGFLKKEIVQINHEKYFTWYKSNIVIELIHESFSIPWTVIYKYKEDGEIVFTEPNHRMGLSRTVDDNKYSSNFFGFFNRATDKDLKKRVDFLRDEIKSCIDRIIDF